MGLTGTEQIRAYPLNGSLAKTRSKPLTPFIVILTVVDLLCE